jgi:hypothetical protein
MARRWGGGEPLTYFASEHTPVKLEIARGIDQLDVRRYFLAHDDVDEVAGDKRGSQDGGLHAVAEDNEVGGEHAPNGSHDA